MLPQEVKTVELYIPYEVDSYVEPALHFPLYHHRYLESEFAYWRKRIVLRGRLGHAKVRAVNKVSYSHQEKQHLTRTGSGSLRSTCLHKKCHPPVNTSYVRLCKPSPLARSSQLSMQQRPQVRRVKELRAVYSY